MLYKKSCRLGLVLCSLLLPVVASGTVYQGNPSNYTALLNTLQPGDTLVLASGSYPLLYLNNLNGTPSAWITVTGPASGAPAIIVGQSCCNTVEINNSSYLAIENLTVDSQGLDGIFGISAHNGLSNITHDILIQNNLLIGQNGSQQTDGISTKTPTWNWTIRGNTITGAGTGLYLGDSDGSSPFIAGVIENNLVQDTIGYDMEIKYQATRPTVPGMPTGPSTTIIRNNVFIKDNQTSPDGVRPNVLVGGFPYSGAGSSDMYEIYGNFFYHNPNESLLQADGRVSIHDNVFVDGQYAAIGLFQTDAPLKIAYVYNNTIYSTQAGIYFSSTASIADGVTGNLIFAATPIFGSNLIANLSNNIVDTFANASLYVSAPSLTMGAMNFYPLTGQAQGSALNLAPFISDIDYGIDFNGTPKNQLLGAIVFRGAYAGQGVNPGWQLQDALKGVTTVGSSTAITIQTTPAGLQFSVDGGPPQAAPQTLSLRQGTHTIAAAATQAGTAGIQYVFSSWSDGLAASHNITVTATPATYTASFTTQYQLTTAVLPSGSGVVTPASGGFYNSGTVVPVNATANSGYSFTSWTGTVAAPNSTSTSVTMAAPESITANFTLLPGTTTIQTSPTGLQFSVDGGPAQVAPKTLSLSQGTHIIAVAATQGGGTGTQFAFTSWSDNGAASHTITVTAAAATYIASFTTEYQLITAVLPAGSGVVTPASGGFYNSGTVVAINATANSGYYFTGWTGATASGNSASTTVTMTAPETVTAAFSSLQGITIHTSPTGLLFSVDGGPAQTAPQTLNLSLGSHTIAVASTQAGTAGTQYVFSSWSDGGAASHSITVTTAPATYTASFTTQYQLTTAVLPSGSGVVTPASGGFYNSGSVVPVNATANSGYSFTSWTGAAAGSNSASTTVTMTAPETVTANFTAVGTGHPAFFAGEVTVGSNIYSLTFPNGNVFGYYGYLGGGWIYHADMGYEYVDPAGNAVYLWDLASGHWLYTNPGSFPYLYDFTLTAWIYYFPNRTEAGHYTTNPRVFANMTTGLPFTM